MFIEYIQNGILEAALFLVRSAVIWVPVSLVIIAWFVWRHYLLLKFLSKRDWILLEVRFPKEIIKSPEAMEVVLGALHQSYAGTWWNQLWEGTVRTWSSLELVSVGGKVHFYIRTERLFKDILEAKIYAQYPEVELYEVEDYTLSIDYQNEEGWKIWGQELKLAKEDPYPIKTYVDYKLDMATSLKEDIRLDPLATTIEYLGSLGSHEQMWIQILIQANKKRVEFTDWWFKEKDWKKEGEELVEKLMDEGKNKDAEGKQTSFPDRTERQKLTIDAINRNISKPGFDCGIRLMYLAKGDYSLAKQVGFGNVFKPFNSEYLNGFKPGAGTGFDFPWQDPFGGRAERKRRIMFNAYRKRSYFYPPYQGNRFVLNSEELATLYHFPSHLISTPSLDRIVSKKVEPPDNLPQ